MDMADIPLLAMLRSRLNYLSQRQQVIAQNVANADTPGYAPQDLKAFSFQARVQAATPTGDPSAMAVTEPGHMTPAHASPSGFQAVTARDSETTLDGNSVVLEDQMLKMGQARQDYDNAITFYQKSLQLIQLAIRAPGHG
jgi:flagellar basal-body rod protein FlgB